MPNANWMLKFRNPSELHGHAIREMVVSRRTRYQTAEIVDSYNYGRVLLLDGVPQSSQVDEFIYHETLVHPAMCAHGDPKDVLIVGAGEGAVLREVVKYSTVQNVTMVDIDEELVGLCDEYMSAWHQGAFHDARATLAFEDGRAFLQRHPNTFDCIILDLSDPFDGSPARGLFSREFYALVKRALKGSGVMALQAENGALGHNEPHRRIIRTLQDVFPAVFPCYAHIPIYSTLFGFAVCGGDELTLTKLTTPDIDSILSERSVSGLRFYDSQTAIGLFSVPLYLRNLLQEPDVPVITDGDSLQVTA